MSCCHEQDSAQNNSHEDNCDSVFVVEHNHQLPYSNIILNDKNEFLKAQRTYYPLIFNL